MRNKNFIFCANAEHFRAYHFLFINISTVTLSCILEFNMIYYSLKFNGKETTTNENDNFMWFIEQSIDKSASVTLNDRIRSFEFQKEKKKA